MEVGVIHVQVSQDKRTLFGVRLGQVRIGITVKNLYENMLKIIKLVEKVFGFLTGFEPAKSFVPVMQMTISIYDYKHQDEHDET